MSKSALVERTYNVEELSLAVKTYLKEEQDINLSDKKCKIFTKAVVASIAEILAMDMDITLPKVGVFRVKQRDARKGRNPSTGEAINIPAKKAVTFKVSSTLKKALNK